MLMVMWLKEQTVNLFLPHHQHIANVEELVAAHVKTGIQV